MISPFLSSILLLATPLSAPHVVVEMKDGETGREVSFNGGRANEAHQAGSIGKYVCTLAALRLENMGRLSLDATVADLLPEFEGAHADQVTLRRLMENRAGLADKLIPALMSDPSLPTQALAPLEATNKYSVGDATKAPGLAFEYINGNWVLIGAILEKASGKPLAQTLKELVLEPAGATSAYIMDGELSGPDPVKAKGQSLPLPGFVACIGGLAATPSDLLAISRYPFVSADFDFDDRTALQMVTTDTEDYTLGGRFKLVLDEQAKTVRRISWQSGNNGPWYAFVAYDQAKDNGIAMVTPDAENGQVVLEKRSNWLSENGLKQAK